MEDNTKSSENLNPVELSALRGLVKDLQGSGWEVISTALAGPNRTPIAVVARGREETPLRTFVAACRSLLRTAEQIPAAPEFSTLTGEELETVQAARLTCRVVAEHTVAFGKTVGSKAHAEMARAVGTQEDALNVGGTLRRLEEIRVECGRVAESTVRFSGETQWDALINHHSLDIVEEQRFREFCAERGLGPASPLADLEAALREWEEKGGRDE